MTGFIKLLIVGLSILLFGKYIFILGSLFLLNMWSLKSICSIKE